MTLTDLKSRLTLSQVLGHYGLRPDKNGMLNCPFHPDRTPSMKIYFETNTAYCFSAKCKTHGKSIDVIDFVVYMEGLSKGEAIQRAKALAGASTHTTPTVLFP